jgi:hypothetical protein
MSVNFQEIYDQLYDHCESEDFAGFDPFDGLNSKIFQATPLKHFAVSRLIWLQMVKRSPKNLRPLLRIEKGINAKGIALFALAELSRFRATNNENHSENAKYLLKILLEQKYTLSPATAPYSSPQKSAFGYNFDWQSRAFFAPRGAPTIVPTAFAGSAFLEAYQLFNNTTYLQSAEEISRFITEDLNRPFEDEHEICFSYTPIDNSVIFNASLLAGEILAGVGEITANNEYLALAEKTANFVISRQKGNGSWAYGTKFRHAWVDNFHTAYILLSLFRLQKIIPSLKERSNLPIQKGLDFWLNNFFLENGTPKYFDKQTYPVDIHSAAAAIVALCELNEIDKRCLPQAGRIAGWTIGNLRDGQGFFYYQKTKSLTIRTSFIRWADAWMAYALAKLIESKISIMNHDS